MNYSDTLQRTWQENILFNALIELTYRCNLNCFICYNDSALKGAPLGTEQYFRFFDDLRELGTLNLTLSGGEPLAHPDFFTLGRKARDMGFLVRVKSNGHALHGRLAQRLRDEVDPFMVEVSLHGATAAVHDRQTRVPGSFVKLIANFRGMREAGMRMKLNCPLTVWNEHEIDGMYAIADDFGVQFQIDPQITRRDDGDLAPLDVSPSREGIARHYEVQRRRIAALVKSQGSRTAEAAPAEAEAKPASTLPEKHCGAGSSTIIVDPYGNVYPCVQWRRKIGNLHEESIRAMWHQSTELAEVRRISSDVKQMVDAQGTQGFSFCPGTAEQETGRATNIYPVARVLLDMRRKIPLN